MDIARKCEIAETSIRSISEHRDEDSTVRKAALTRLTSYIADQVEAIDAETAARVEAQVSPQP